ncbi:MAG: zinc ribbon domain-containing protein, partial [Ruminococcus sp.]|nr:zinc ribbon domain-containing protein [Ruminococcus sp.]
MNCPNCNNPLQPHQRFCPACGTRVEALTSDAQQAADQWQPQSVQPEPQQAEWRPQSVQPEPQQAEWRPQSVQPEPQQAEWRPQEV